MWPSQNGISAEKCFLNPFGVDTRLFQPRAGVPDKIRFVAVGTLCLCKGYQYLFRAMEIVKRQLPNAELVCIGKLKADLRRELRR